MYKIATLTLYCFMMLVVVVGGVELGARYLLDFDQTRGLRPLVPYAMTGDFFAGTSTADIVDAPQGPVAAGYHKTNGIFLYSPGDVPIAADDFANYVFTGTYARHSREEIDALDTDRVRIFVIGGSVAQGSGASGKETVWHGVLETKLRAAFSTDRIDVFGAGMGAFVSSQERLVFDWSIVKRAPDIVIDINGFNDVIFPLSGSIKPSDPLQMPRIYSDAYDRSWTHLAQYSAALRPLVHQRALQALFANNAATFEMPAKAATLRQSIRNVYAENMNAILESCRLRSIDCFIFLQPYRDLTRREAGTTAPISDFDAWHFELYRSLPGLFEGESRFLDISGIYTKHDFENIYTDTVHANDIGQALMADAIFEAISATVARRLATK